VKPVLPAFCVVLAVGLAQPPFLAAQVSTGGNGAGRALVSPFMRGVPSGSATADTLALSVGDAITRALAHNLGVLTTEQGVERAQGARVKALADLLPNVMGRLSESRQEVNLSAYGFPLPAGTPPVVGPYNLFDARVFVSQSVFDLRATNEVRAEGHNQTAARLSARSSRDTVVLVAANAYLQALAAEARATSAQAQLKTAEAIYAQTTSLKAGGLVAGIDVLRADVQRNAERQRATAAANDAEKGKLQLARLIGLPLGQAISLSDQLPFVPAPDMTLDAALERAYRTRPDYQSALERLRAAEAKRQAAVAEALPSVRSSLHPQMRSLHRIFHL
jgi:outer membrane protein TolC